MLKVNRSLLNEFGDAGWTLIHYAVFYEHIHLLEYLIKLDVSLDLVTSDGWTPLQLAIKKRNLRIFKRLAQAKGIDINKVTEKGTVLHLAVKMNLPEFVDVLIENKADDSLKDESGKKAVDYCEDQSMV